MMLVQKPPTFNHLTQAVPHTHRRHPSAPPAVVVQPTKIPGLLSVSKPARSTPQRQLPSNQRNNAKSAQRSKQQPLTARAPTLLNPAEITEKKPALAVLQPPPSPTPQARGRSSAKSGKDKVLSPKRSVSSLSVRGKHGRQPSPPVEVQMHPPSQAEVTSIPSSNPFDPFLDTSDKPKTSPLKNKKTTTQMSSPAPSEAIPVPKVHRPKRPHLARSDPVVSTVRPRQPPKRSAGGPPSGKFPVCDDDDETLSDADSPPLQTPPVTPVRKQTFTDSGFASAPAISKGASNFQFSYPSPPPSQKKGRKHFRTPSEGVFNMSSDEELSTGPSGTPLNQILFPFARNRAPNSKPPTTPSPSLSRATAAAVVSELNSSSMDAKDLKKAGYYASSLFQNSPSPDELPDPLLF